MPESLTKSEITSQTDPSVAKQYDTTSPLSQKLSDLYAITDALKIGLLGTIRPNLIPNSSSSPSGPVSRSMAVAKRQGPDFLFLANTHSKKFTDLAHNPTVSLTFQNSSTQDWVSIAGTATKASGDSTDPRIKEIYKPGVNAWFGDLGDGVHTGGPEDPRMAIIEVKAQYVTYWKSEVSSVGYVKEVVVAAVTGKVANTGVLRELGEKELEEARRMEG